MWSLIIDCIMRVTAYLGAISSRWIASQKYAKEIFAKNKAICVPRTTNRGGQATWKRAEQKDQRKQQSQRDEKTEKNA